MKELNKDENLSITGGYFPPTEEQSYRENYHLLVNGIILLKILSEMYKNSVSRKAKTE